MHTLPQFIGPLLFSYAITAALLGAVSGTWLLFSPAGFAHFEARVGSPFSLRRGLRPFDISRNIDRYFYRHHHAIGLLVIAGSIYNLYAAMFDVIPEKIDPLLVGRYPPAITDWLVDSLHYFLLLGNLFAVVIGLVIYVRPSALKSFETRANRWFTARKKTLWLSTHLGDAGEVIRSRPRTLGVVILLLSVYLASAISTG